MALGDIVWPHESKNHEKNNGLFGSSGIRRVRTYPKPTPFDADNFPREAGPNSFSIAYRVLEKCAKNLALPLVNDGY